MKKLFALALVVLGLAACQTDHSDLDVQFDGNATITLSIPADAVTRAGGSDSATSGLDNTANETLRFILEIYDENGDKKIRETQYANENTLTANFPVRLVPGRSYTFVAWADIVTTEGEDNHYDTSSGLENITLKGDWNAMDETRDAFTASKTITSYSSNEVLNMQLTRPFAKVRVIATDVADIARLGLTATHAKVAYTTKVPVSYNAFAQTTVDTESVNHEYEIAAYTANNNETTQVLYTDYIFANDEQGAVKFTLTTYEDAEYNKKIREVNFNTDIPVKRNMLTTLTGNVMTEGNNVSVEVKPVFPDEGGKHNITAISSYEDLLTAIGNGGEYLVINDIAINLPAASSSSFAVTRTSEEPAEGTTPAPTGKTTTINLNGFTITVNNNSDTAAITILAGNTLVIAGNGSIELTADSTNAVFNNDEGQVIIAGGELEDNATDTNANIFTKEENVKNIVAELKAAFAGELELENNTYTLEADVTLSETLTLAADKTLVLDLGNFTINGVNNISDKNNDGKITSADNAVLIDVRGALTIKNGTVKFTHKGQNFGWNACTENFYVGFNGTLNVENATIENLGGTDMAYAIDLVNAQENLNLTISSNSHIKSTYIPVRVFNNGAGMNNVTIKNSTLEGVSRAFWVHVYSNKDNGGKGIKNATLNLDIFGNGNTFIANNPNRIIEFGFDDVLNYDAEGNLVIYDKYRLQSLAKYVNGGKTFEGKTIKLVADIDLNNEEWTPIGYWTTFNGIFDGQNHTISNLKHYGTEEDCYVGLFGYTENATIKNLTINNVDLKLIANADWAGGHMGALVGNIAGNTVIENIKVTGLVKIDGDLEKAGAGRIGGVVGGNVSNVLLKNVVVDAAEGSFVKGNSSIGGIAGQLQGETTFENCSSNVNVSAQQFYAGGIVGLAYRITSFENCSTSGNISVLAGRSGNDNDLYRVGAIAGGWDDNITTTLTLTNCSYTGTLSGKSTDGTTATKFDCNGLVGRGYSAVVGAKINVDGYVYEYAGDGIYNIYDADGYKLINVSTEEEFTAALKALGEKDKIILNADITVANKWDNRNNGAKTSKPIFIDGNNKTLKFTGEISDGFNYQAAFRFEKAAVVKNLTIDMSEVAGTGSWLRAISTKGDITIDNCTFIGSTNYTSGRGLAFGEGAGTAISDVVVSVTNSTFTNWTRRGLTDNENAQDAKEVVVENNRFNNANAYISAHDSVRFVGNTMNNSAANIKTYTNATDATVVATDNTLDANYADYNIISGFVAENVTCQEGFIVK